MRRLASIFHSIAESVTKLLNPDDQCFLLLYDRSNDECLYRGSKALIQLFDQPCGLRLDNVCHPDRDESLALNFSAGDGYVLGGLNAIFQRYEGFMVIASKLSRASTHFFGHPVLVALFTSGCTGVSRYNFAQTVNVRQFDIRCDDPSSILGRCIVPGCNVTVDELAKWRVVAMASSALNFPADRPLQLFYPADERQLSAWSDQFAVRSSSLDAAPVCSVHFASWQPSADSPDPNQFFSLDQISDGRQSVGPVVESDCAKLDVKLDPQVTDWTSVVKWMTLPYRQLIAPRKGKRLTMLRRRQMWKKSSLNAKRHICLPPYSWPRLFNSNGGRTLHLRRAASTRPRLFFTNCASWFRHVRHQLIVQSNETDLPGHVDAKVSDADDREPQRRLCSSCPANWNDDSNSWFWHMVRVHHLFCCQACGEPFDSVQNLANHITGEKSCPHESEDKYARKISHLKCGRTVYPLRGLAVGSSLLCSVCDSIFDASDATNVTNHVKCKCLSKRTPGPDRLPRWTRFNVKKDCKIEPVSWSATESRGQLIISNLVNGDISHCSVPDHALVVANLDLATSLVTLLLATDWRSEFVALASPDLMHNVSSFRVICLPHLSSLGVSGIFQLTNTVDHRSMAVMSVTLASKPDTSIPCNKENKAPMRAKRKLKPKILKSDTVKSVRCSSRERRVSRRLQDGEFVVSNLPRVLSPKNVVREQKDDDDRAVNSLAEPGDETLHKLSTTEEIVPLQNGPDLPPEVKFDVKSSEATDQPCLDLISQSSSPDSKHAGKCQLTKTCAVFVDRVICPKSISGASEAKLKTDTTCASEEKPDVVPEVNVELNKSAKLVPVATECVSGDERSLPDVVSFAPESKRDRLIRLGQEVTACLYRIKDVVTFFKDTCEICFHSRSVAVEAVFMLNHFRDSEFHTNADSQTTALLGHIEPSAYLTLLSDYVDALATKTLTVATRSAATRDILFRYVETADDDFIGLYKCCYCPDERQMAIDSYIGWANHMQSCHQSGQPDSSVARSSSYVLACAICSNNFLNYGSYLYHVCHGNQLTTATASSLQTASAKLSSQLAASVNSVAHVRFRCRLCSKHDITSFIDFQSHLRKSHCICDICMTVHGNQRSLRDHCARHGRLELMCLRCFLTYEDRNSFRKHLHYRHGPQSGLGAERVCRMCHERTWPHVYHFCLYSSSAAAAAAASSSSTVSDGKRAMDHEILERSDADLKTEFDYKCEVCDRNFGPDGLKPYRVHLRQHSGEKPYMCSAIMPGRSGGGGKSCDKTFIAKTLLWKHQIRKHPKTHGHCFRSLAEKRNLRRMAQFGASSVVSLWVCEFFSRSIVEDALDELVKQWQVKQVEHVTESSDEDKASNVPDLCHDRDNGTVSESAPISEIADKLSPSTTSTPPRPDLAVAADSDGVDDVSSEPLPTRPPEETDSRTPPSASAVAAEGADSIGDGQTEADPLAAALASILDVDGNVASPAVPLKSASVIRPVSNIRSPVRLGYVRTRGGGISGGLPAIRNNSPNGIVVRRGGANFRIFSNVRHPVSANRMVAIQRFNVCAPSKKDNNVPTMTTNGTVSLTASGTRKEQGNVVLPIGEKALVNGDSHNLDSSSTNGRQVVDSLTGASAKYGQGGSASTPPDANSVGHADNNDEPDNWELDLSEDSGDNSDVQAERHERRRLLLKRGMSRQIDGQTHGAVVQSVGEISGRRLVRFRALHDHDYCYKAYQLARAPSPPTQLGRRQIRPNNTFVSSLRKDTVRPDSAHASQPPVKRIKTLLPSHPVASRDESAVADTTEMDKILSRVAIGASLGPGHKREAHSASSAADRKRHKRLTRVEREARRRKRRHLNGVVAKGSSHRVQMDELGNAIRVPIEEAAMDSSSEEDEAATGVVGNKKRISLANSSVTAESARTPTARPVFSSSTDEEGSNSSDSDGTKVSSPPSLSNVRDGQFKSTGKKGCEPEVGSVSSASTTVPPPTSAIDAAKSDSESEDENEPASSDLDTDFEADHLLAKMKQILSLTPIRGLGLAGSRHGSSNSTNDSRISTSSQRSIKRSVRAVEADMRVGRSRVSNGQPSLQPSRTTTPGRCLKRRPRRLTTQAGGGGGGRPIKLRIKLANNGSSPVPSPSPASTVSPSTSKAGAIILSKKKSRPVSSASDSESSSSSSSVSSTGSSSSDDGSSNLNSSATTTASELSPAKRQSIVSRSSQSSAQLLNGRPPLKMRFSLAATSGKSPPATNTTTTTITTNGAIGPTKTNPRRLFCVCRTDRETPDMIACDAGNCAYEWFHFECVDIVVPPDGQWFCPSCSSSAAAKTVVVNQRSTSKKVAKRLANNSSSGGEKLIKNKNKALSNICVEL